MSTTHAPPTEGVLRRFLVGDLPAPEAERVEAWLSTDPSAAAILDQLEAVDTLATVVAAVGTHITPDVAAEALASKISGAVSTTLLTTKAFATDSTLPDSFLFSGMNWDGYQIVGELGRGGMGVVYEAVDSKLGRRVALKVMAVKLATEPTARERFIREARAAAAVDHDNIVPVYQIGEHNGVPFIAMPRLAGTTLADRLDAGPMPLTEVVVIARQVADALAAAHNAGLVHRDVKPSNVWLEHHPDGTFRRARVLDFGLARAIATDGKLTGSNQVLGTPAFMAPEQAWGRPLDHRADLFSLGVVLYRMATGVMPFQAHDSLALLSVVALHEPATPRTVNPEVPEALSTLVMRLLAKDPVARHASATEVTAELDRVTFAPAEPATKPAPAPAETPIRPRRRRGFAIAAGLLASCLIALGGWVLIKIRNQDGTETTLKVPDGSNVTVGPDGSVTVVPPKGKDSGPAPQPDGPMTERASAEWVVRNRGFITCVIPAEGNRRVDVRKLEDIPAKPFVVDLVWLDGNATGVLTDETVANLRGLTGVKTLLLDRQPLTDAGWGTLLQLPGFRTLGEIDLGETGLTAAVFRTLPTLPNLWKVFTKTTATRADELAPLKSCAKLSTLAFHVQDMPVAGYAHLRGLGLKHLTINGNGSPLPPELLDTAASQQGLSYLHLSKWDMREADLSKLRALRFLETFWLYESDLKPDALASLPTWPALREFRTVLKKDADAHLANLGKVPKLGTLMFNFSQVATDAGLDALHAAKALKIIECRGCPKLTAEGVRRLSAAVPKCIIKLDREAYQGGKVLTPSPVPDVMAARRKAAEWAWGKLKAEIHLLLPDGRWQVGWADGNLPPEFLIGKLVVHNNPAVTDAALKEHLPGLDGLRDLDLGGCAVTDESLTHVAKLPHLTRLQVGRLPGMTDRTLESLAGHKSLSELGTCSNGFTAAGLAQLKTIPNLKLLGIWKVGITDRWLEAIGAVTSLEGLWIEDILPDSRVTPEGLSYLKNLKRLKKLVLRGPLIDDAWLAPCAGMTVLEALDLPSTRVGDAGLAHLSDLPKLAGLFLQDTRVTGAGMKHLAKCPSLWNLWLFGLPIDDAGAEDLAASTSLRRIILRDSLVTDKGAKALAKIPTLEEFGAQGCRLTDAALEALAANPRIVSVGATGLKITDRGVAALAKNPDMAVLVLPDTAITDASVPAISGLKKLNRLDLTRTKVTPAGFTALKAALPNCNIEGGPAITPAEKMAAQRKVAEWAIGLKAEAHILLPTGHYKLVRDVAELPPAFEIVKVVFGGNPPLTGPAALEPLTLIDTLTDVYFHDCNELTAEALKPLARCPKLSFAEFIGSKVGDAGLQVLAELPKLEKLKLARTPVSAAGLAELQKFKRLRTLDVHNLTLKEDSLLALSRVANLHTLRIVQCHVVSAGFEHLGALQSLTRFHIYESNVGNEHLRRLPPMPAVEWFGLTLCLVNDDGLAGLEKWPALANLLLDRTEVKGSGLKHIAKCPKLAKLTLDRNPVTSDGLIALAESKSITDLRIEGTTMTDAAAAAIAGMEKLDWIHAVGCNVNDAHCKAFSLSQSLTKVGVSGPQLTDKAIENFANNPRIVQLGILNSGLTDWSYPVMKGMKHLTWLDVTGSRITPTGIGAIRKALPKCAVLPEGPTPVYITEDGRKALQWAIEKGAEVGVAHFNDYGRGFTFKKSITELDDYLWADWLIPANINFHKRPVLDPKTVENLRGLSSLVNLSIEQQPLGDEGFAKLAAMPLAKTMRDLWAGTSGITDAGAKHLAAFEGLHKLSLSGTRLTKDGAAHLRKLSKLKALLWGETLTDESLEAIQGLALTELHINGNPELTDLGIAHLAGFPDLGYLTLGSPKITDATVAKVLPSLPKLGHLYLGGQKLGPKALSSIADCKALTWVELSGFSLSDENLTALRLPPTARTLWFLDFPKEVEMSDAAIKQLSGFKQLKEIQFARGTPSDDVAKKLSASLPDCAVRTQQGLFQNGEKK